MGYHPLDALTDWEAIGRCIALPYVQQRARQKPMVASFLKKSPFP
jgi:hypothetical protein